MSIKAISKWHWALGLLLITLNLQAAPQIQHWVTANGARVYFVPAPELPMVDIRVLFDAGSARDPATRGVALMTNGLLTEGAGGRSSDEIAAHFEGLGARLGNNALRDMAWVSLRSLSDPRYLQPALRVLSDILARPDFRAEDFERERQRLLVGLKAKEQNPGQVADEAFYKAIYGDHPYAHPTAGDLDSAQAMSIKQLRQFHGRYYVGNNAVIALVGAISRDQAEQIAAQVVGDLPTGEAAPPLPEVEPLTEARTVRIPHPSKQSHILMGQPGMRRGDEDYFPLYVANHSLGGSGLVSRLAGTIREEHGLAYSVYSYFRPMRAKGPYQLGLQTANHQVDQALSLLRQELKQFVREGPEAHELEASQLNITGGFPLKLDGNSKIIGYLGMIGFYQLPLDYLDRFNERVMALSLEQLRETFQRRVDPERMVTVIVGGS